MRNLCCELKGRKGFANFVQASFEIMDQLIVIIIKNEDELKHGIQVCCFIYFLQNLMSGFARIHYVMGMTLNLRSSCLSPPQCWDYSYVLPHPVYSVLETEPKALCLLGHYFAEFCTYEAVLYQLSYTTTDFVFLITVSLA